MGDLPNPVETRANAEENGVHFCLLAEFDIDAGATLAHQYPYPTGTDEHRLAELMLPDGAHHRAEDWTIFYLGQSSSNAITSVLQHEAVKHGSLDDAQTATEQQKNSKPNLEVLRGQRGAGREGGLLYVLNCVRMKEDKSMRRGAMVKSLAICTPNPYIGIYKPLLLLALEEYFLSPSPAVLGRLYDAANAISIDGMPSLSRHQRIILRASERKDLFEDKFGASLILHENESGQGEAASLSAQERLLEEEAGSNEASSISSPVDRDNGSIRPTVTRHDSTSSSSHVVSDGGFGTGPDPFGLAGSHGPSSAVISSRQHRSIAAKGTPRDTHFFDTTATFQKISVPIRIPLTVFDEDVGDYSIIQLVQTFTPPQLQAFPAPHHPQLHSNGAFTHPVILILNAMLAHKRVIFLGHGQPSNDVARMVLAACALASGSGQVLRGVTATAFPYANLASLDILEEFPGFVAGVTNPRFEELPGRWDILCNTENGKITVSKDFRSSGVAGAGTDDGHGHEQVQSSGAEDDSGGQLRNESKVECADNIFMEEIMAAISSHFGEGIIRVRFADYLSRFVRVAARYEQDAYGSTQLDFSSRPFRGPKQLGSGATFTDDSSRRREISSLRARIEAWRQTPSCFHYREDFKNNLQAAPLQDFDLHHQLARLRQTRTMSDEETCTIFDTFARLVLSEDQVTEFLAALPSHLGGLAPIGAGLFHSSPQVRMSTIILLQNLEAYQLGCIAVASLNAFHRIALLRLSADFLPSTVEGYHA